MWLQGDVFMNQLLGLTIEFYMEFAVAIYLHWYYPVVVAGYTGDFLGAMITVFIIILTFVVVPIVLIVFIIKYPGSEMLTNKEFESTWGALYEDHNVATSYQMSYYLVYLVRRLAFLMLATYVKNEDDCWIQIIGLMVMNLANIIYLGSAEAWIPRIYYRMDLLNDWFIGTVSIHLVLFTEFVTKAEQKYYYGWQTIGIVLAFIIINMYFVFTNAMHQIKILCIYCGNRCGCVFKKPPTEEEIVEE